MQWMTMCVLFAATLGAADVTGKWRGTVTTEMARQTTGGTIPAYMALQQSDGKVTGSAGEAKRCCTKSARALSMAIG